MILLETSFLINYYVDKAKHHREAIKIMEKISDKEKIITSMIIFECLTVLRKLNQNNKQVRGVYNNLLNLNVYDESIYYDIAVENCLNNDVGFFDNLTHVFMTNEGIKEIASFDSDFDKLNGITRIH